MDHKEIREKFIYQLNGNNTGIIMFTIEEARQLLDENQALQHTVDTLVEQRNVIRERAEAQAKEIERLQELSKKQQASLDAEYKFYNNGFEEERYALQEENIELREDILRYREALQCILNEPNTKFRIGDTKYWLNNARSIARNALNHKEDTNHET